MTYRVDEKTWLRQLCLGVLVAGLAAFVPACGDDEGSNGGSAGSAGMGGSAGMAGMGGSAGMAGMGGMGGSMGMTFDLSFSGMGYQGPHDTQTMYFTLWDDADDSAPVNMWSVTIDADPLVTSQPDALMGGVSYTLHYFVDTNNSMACEGPALEMDHAWSMAIPAVMADVEVTDTHSLEFNGDCSRH